MSQSKSQYPHQTTNSSSGYNHMTYDNPTSNMPPNLTVQIDAIVQTVIELANKTICPNETLTEIIGSWKMNEDEEKLTLEKFTRF